MKRFLPLIALILFVGCTDSDAPAQSEATAEVTESPESNADSNADSNDLTGSWELVEQKGYGPNHPDDVVQTLTFDDTGRLTNVQSAGGVSSEMVLTYRVEGDQIKASVESMTMNGEPRDVPDEMPEQTFQWRIENGRLILEGAQPGAQDVYRRVD